MFLEQASLNLTLCLFVQFKNVTANQHSEVLHRVSNCPYRLAIKATSHKGDSPWSEYKYFGNVISLLLLYHFNWSRLYFTFIFFILCRGRSSPLHVCCHFLPTDVYWPGNHSSYLLQEVCGRFSSSPFAIHACLMCGNSFLQEKGRNISKNTRTKGPPQQYSRQQLQGKFLKI